MRAQTHARSFLSAERRGGALLNVALTIALLLILFVLLMPSCCSSGGVRETGRQNTCRENLRRLTVALNDYHNRHGHYPGYANSRYENPLLAADGTTPVGVGPVSWVALLLDTVDHLTADDVRRGRSIDSMPSSTAGPTASSSATATATATASATPTGTAPPRLGPGFGYRGALVCPSLEIREPRGPLLSYVANTGMPDLQQAIAAEDGGKGIPRDWPANGVFFDRSFELSDLDDKTRRFGPQITMRRDMIRDPRDKTILLAENSAAGPYVLEPSDIPNGNVADVEMIWGTVWGGGPITEMNTTKNSASPQGRLSMQPPADLLGPNFEPQHREPATKYRYSRPASLHPQGSNFAFVAGNVVFMRETLNYLIYAKLMASDDANVKLPGSLDLFDERFRKYELTDEDLNP